MVRALIRQSLGQRHRLIGVIVALTMGVGFLAMTLQFGTILDEGTRNTVGAEFRHIDLAVEASTTPLTSAHAEALAVIPGVRDVQPVDTAWIDVRSSSRAFAGSALSLPGNDAMLADTPLTAGRFPERSGELVITDDAARQLRVQIGGMVRVTGSDSPAMNVTIVGTWSGEQRIGDAIYDALAFPSDYLTWRNLPETWAMYVVFADDADRDVVETSVIQALDDESFTVTGKATLMDRAMARRVEMTGIQQRGVQAFGLLALLVAGIVVSNTLAILVAQRMRDIALLRCAGGTAAQMRTMVLLEAMAIGMLAALLGVTGSTLMVNAGLRVLHRVVEAPYLPATAIPTVGTVLVCLIAGLAVSLCAAWLPARSATRVDPLEALRSSSLREAKVRGPGMLTSAAALLLLSAGGGAMSLGMLMSYGEQRGIALFAGMVGGLLSFFGIMLGSSLVVPMLARMLAHGSARLGVTARLAASNGVRNPRRLTATTMALVIGVALVAMMLVGAESLKASLENQVDSEAPWDVAVTVPTGTDGRAFGLLVPEIANLDGVSASAPMSSITAEMTQVGGSVPEAYRVRVVDHAALASVLRDQDAALEFLPGTIIVPDAYIPSLVGEGETLTVTIGATSRAYRVLVVAGFTDPVMTRADVPTAPESMDGLWMRLDGSVDGGDIAELAYGVADQHGQAVDVDVLATHRESLDSALDALLAVVTAMLLVAVAIALVGVGNTLTLSVIERTRESALLRALGMTRRQVQCSLAIEGGLLALLGTAIGIVLGTAYGWIGAVTLIGSTFPLDLEFPLARIALVVVIALACGVLASVLPARRAGKVDPVVELSAV